MLQRYKFFSKYYSDIPKIHHDLLAVYDIDTLHGRGQARDMYLSLVSHGVIENTLGDTISIYYIG